MALKGGEGESRPSPFLILVLKKITIWRGHFLLFVNSPQMVIKLPRIYEKLYISVQRLARSFGTNIKTNTQTDILFLRCRQTHRDPFTSLYGWKEIVEYMYVIFLMYNLMNSSSVLPNNFVFLSYLNHNFDDFSIIILI